nr:hypothetical protein 4p_00090 [Serratia proteamaculans]ULG15123.1 hypothetical protein 163p1_00049 [Serratia proteamaculans]ULG16337.1 hypothetical protein 1129p_00109 [Serratia proteamaculans]ULG19432.1 hypothetical protein SpFp1_00025 [Serratia proteamaculans]
MIGNDSAGINIEEGNSYRCRLQLDKYFGYRLQGQMFATQNLRAASLRQSFYSGLALTSILRLYREMLKSNKAGEPLAQRFYEGKE